MCAEIIDFWFADENKAKWFDKDSNFDAKITERFGELYRQEKDKFAIANITNAKYALGLIILFDQFPRNMFRGDKKSFATDDMALEVALFSLKRSFDNEFEPEKRKFFYMPFMHSEELPCQEMSVELFAGLGNKYSLDFAVRHKVIIEQFGRFPHRNEILGRKSTEEEIAFLATPNSSF